MKRCISCGAELDTEAKFCNECGSKQPPQGTKCIQCGAELQPGAKFCTECGAKQIVKKQFCANCGSELNDGMKFCVECGAPVHDNCIPEKGTVPAVEKHGPQPESFIEEDPIVDLDCDYEARYNSDKELFGYVDDDENWVINPQFESAEDFDEGYGCIKLDGKWGYIKPDGTYLLEPQFDKVNSFYKGMATVKRNGKWGYIKPNGKYLIEPKFDNAKPFYEGFAAVEINGKYGYIKTDGTYLIEPKFDYAEPFNEGFATVNVNGKKGIIRSNGSFFVKPIFDWVLGFSNGKTAIEIKGEKWSEIKKGELFADGSLILEGKKVDVTQLYTDTLTPKKNSNGKVGFVDVDGDWVISPEFDKAGDFSNDDIAFVEKDGKCGFIKSDGSYLIEPIYEEAQGFSEGYAKVKRNGKYGFIKTDGSYLAKHVFEEAEYFDHGRAYVKLEGSPSGYLYPDGTVLIGSLKIDVNTLNENEDDKNNVNKDSDNSEKGKSKTRKLTPFEDEDGKWGYRDQNGNIAVLANFDYAEPFEGDYARVILCSNEMFIDKKGTLCYDRNGTEYEYTPEENDTDSGNSYDDESYDDSSYEKNKKKSILGGMLKAGLKSVFGESPASGSTSSRPSQSFRKIWRCTYVGRNRAVSPKVLDVPSMNTTGMPCGNDFVEAFKKLGYDDRTAHDYAEGGSNLSWKCE